MVTMGTPVLKLSSLLLPCVYTQAAAVMPSLLLGSVHSCYWSLSSGSVGSSWIAVTGSGRGLIFLAPCGAFLEATFIFHLLQSPVNWRVPKSVLGSNGLHEFLEAENRSRAAILVP